MTPRVSYEGEIILELSVESSALGPSISVAGQDAPSFSSRKVATRLRLREGESNLLAGLLRDEQRKVLTGFPGIMRMPVLRSLFGQTNDQVEQSDIVMLLTPHIVRTHELTADDLAPIYIGTQQNVGLGGPPPLIAPQPEPAPAPTSTTGSGLAPGVPPAGVPRPPVAADPGAQPVNRPTPPGMTPVPSMTPPGPAAATPAPGTPPGGAVPAGTPAETPVAAPPRDTTAPAPAPPGPAAASNVTATQVIITPPGTEFRVAGGPYTVPLSINNASRVSVMTLTITFNPNVLRVRTVQDGTFMRQGGVPTTFTPRIDAAAGRVDIAITRSADQTGASGAGLLAALVMDAVGPGGSVLQVSGVASTPEGGPVTLQVSPVTVTVR
jgi:general secretion pathway protein D